MISTKFLPGMKVKFKSLFDHTWTEGVVADPADLADFNNNKSQTIAELDRLNEAHGRAPRVWSFWYDGSRARYVGEDQVELVPVAGQKLTIKTELNRGGVEVNKNPCNCPMLELMHQGCQCGGT